MPNDPTAEQTELRRKGRQRLVGAVTLALLAVVFVPMLLDPEPRRERVEPLLTIPPRDGVPALPPAPALPESPGGAGDLQATAVETPPAATTKPDSPATEPATVETRKTVEPKAAEFRKPPPKAAVPKAELARVEAPKVEATKADAPKLEGFAVQVGAFKDEARLKQAREKLTAAGISHYIDRQPDFTRLRAGPFPTREAAENALAGMKRAGLDGRVVPLP